MLIMEGARIVANPLAGTSSKSEPEQCAGSSKLQGIILPSSTKAEYSATMEAGKEI